MRFRRRGGRRSFRGRGRRSFRRGRSRRRGLRPLRVGHRM